MKKNSPDSCPSLFIVSSPFQALCALEAIEAFQITEYKFIACVIGDVRDKQLFNLLNEKNIEYDILNFKGVKYYNICFAPLFNKSRYRYYRAFVGEPDSLIQRHVAYMFLPSHSYIAFLDDGTKNIPLLMGHRNHLLSKYLFIERIVRFILGIKISNLFFTLFSDVAIRKFQCVENTFSSLVRDNSEKKLKGIYFIGTNSEMYCRKLGISLSSYLSSLEEQLSAIQVKYPDETIYYVPHGRDLNSRIEKYCNKRGIKYVPVSKTIELYVLEQPFQPLAIYANTSTALFNLKKMFPNTDAYNIFCITNVHGKYYKDYMMYSKYFEKHGIKMVREVGNI